MAFKALFMAHAPDAEKEEHCSEIKTAVYHLYVVVVKNQQEALEVAKTYTAEKQISPLGIVIRFPDTTMDIFERVYIPPPNEVIRSVTADEVVEDNAATSYIFIGFQKDTQYEVTVEGNALQVVFPKAPALSKDAGVQKEFAVKKPKGSAAKRPASKSVALSVAAATRLKKVTVTPQNDHLVVKVEADGNIKNYKRFAMRQPARIIIDMYDLTSPYKQEKIIAVED